MTDDGYLAQIKTPDEARAVLTADNAHGIFIVSGLGWCFPCDLYHRNLNGCRELVEPVLKERRLRLNWMYSPHGCEASETQAREYEQMMAAIQQFLPGFRSPKLVPTTVFYKNRQEIFRESGTISTKDLVELIKARFPSS